jgi:ribosomal protein S18 acetylase RimI-like enzyme
VLDALDAAGARATFFMVGEQVEAHRELAREVAGRGHEIALHGFGHTSHDKLVPTRGREDLKRGREVVAGATGSEPVFYRPPYGLFSAETHEACLELGMRPVYWSAWGMDWEPFGPERIFDLATRDVAPGMVLVLHDSARYAPRESALATAAALPAICAAVTDAGLALVALGDVAPEELAAEEAPSAAGVAVRDATRDDVSAIAAIHAEGFNAAYGGNVPSGVLAERGFEQRRGQWQTVLAAQASRSHMLVAEDDGRVVGFSSGGPSRDVDARPAAEAQVFTLFVAEAERGTGVGRALLERSLERLAREGFREVTLWMVPENERGARFYEAAGFTPDGVEREGRLGIPVTEQRVRRTLLP